ncbi:ERF2 [Symbiodinium sp. KB8]|nr:ERF2 [Symbiodinium sp. KB8]
MLHTFFLFAQLVELQGQLSLVCSGISPTIPGRVTLYFGSRAAPSEPLAGGVKVRSPAGLETTQAFEVQCAPAQPIDPSRTTSSQWAQAITDACSSGEAKGRLIGDQNSKITCYKRYPDIEPLDSETGGNFHLVAVGETNDASTDLVPSTAAGLVRSFWVVPIDDMAPGWLALGQDPDGPLPMEPCPDLPAAGRTVRAPWKDEVAMSDEQCWGFPGKGRCILAQWASRVDGGGSISPLPVQGTTPPVSKKRKSDIKTDSVQAFCSNVPDGFLCPIVCSSSQRARRPFGVVQCQDGSWSISVKCRRSDRVCVSGVSPVQVETKNGRSLRLSGIIPDSKSECDLFSRKGKKCGALCAGQGEVSTGQVKCSSGRRRQVYWKALNKFDCLPASTDSLVNQPTIVHMEPGDRDSIQITADVIRDPTKILSPINTFFFREPTETMSCTALRNALELTRNRQDDEADDPDEDEEDDEEEDSGADEGGSCDADADFVQESNHCFPGEAGSGCAACSGEDFGNRDCWSSGSRSRECAGSPRSGDYLSCPFSGQFDGKAEACFAKPPEGYCVKKVCAFHGSQKSCRSYNPPTSGLFCVGDAEVQEPIDHVVIRYTCCNPNLLTFIGSCGRGSSGAGRRLVVSGPSRSSVFSVMAGAQNLAGTSWSLPSLLSCAPISLSSQLDKEKYEIPQKCSNLLPGESCEVGCGSKYLLQRKTGQGTFTCQWGLNRPPAGTLPECKLKPSGENTLQGKAQVDTTTTTTAIPPLCEVCAEIGNYADSRFEQCRFWGDPHITKSWRPKSRFNFQDTGIHRYARSNMCAGNFELHVFQCQYNRGRNAVAIGFAARMNGNETVFISDRRVETSGGVFVEPDAGILNDRAGVNVQSRDECVFFNVNVKHITKQPGFLHNFKLHMLGEDITADGICGAADLKSQYIAPSSPDMIFTREQHQYLCDTCVGAGATPPRGCSPDPADPPDFPSGCDFLAPLSGIDQVCTTEDDGRVAGLEDNGRNCAVYAVLNKKKSCNEYCRERGSTCVAAKSDRGPCKFPSSFNNEKCSKSNMYDVHCVCQKPDNTNPGTTPIQACEASDVTLQQAEGLCRANDFLQTAVFPPRYEEEGSKTTTEQDEADDMLKVPLIQQPWVDILATISRASIIILVEAMGCRTSRAIPAQGPQHYDKVLPEPLAATDEVAQGEDLELGPEALPAATLLTSKSLQQVEEAMDKKHRHEETSPSAHTGRSASTKADRPFVYCGVDVQPALPVVLPTSTVLASAFTLFVLKSHMVLAGMFGLLSLTAHCCMAYCASSDPGQIAEDPSEQGGALPPRAHKSWLYPKPILRHDHYCRWLHNVIGLRNHRAFIAMLVSLAMLVMAGLLADAWFLFSLLHKGIRAWPIEALSLLHLGFCSLFLRLELQILRIQVGLVSRNELNSEWKEDFFWTAPSGVPAKELEVEEYNELLDVEALVYDASRNEFDNGCFNNCWIFWCHSRSETSGDW